VQDCVCGQDLTKRLNRFKDLVQMTFESEELPIRCVASKEWRYNARANRGHNGFVTCRKQEKRVQEVWAIWRILARCKREIYGSLALGCKSASSHDLSQQAETDVAADRSRYQLLLTPSSCYSCTIIIAWVEMHAVVIAPSQTRTLALLLWQQVHLEAGGRMR
jgi:hypothetical protein